MPLLAEAGIVISVIALSSLLELPFEIYRQFVLEARFGFNRMTPRLFIVDLLKSTALGVVLGLPLLLAVLWLMREAGDRWWLWVWTVWTVFNVAVLLIYPTWIAPLFNRFTPLEAGAVRSRVEALLARCGFSSDGLFVMDGSRRSAHGNAYFTGFGKGKRVVFFDTLLSRLDVDELEAVLAHELGHFRKRHVIRRVILSFAASLAGLALLGWLATQRWFYEGLGVSSLASAVAAPGVTLILFFLVMPVFGFALRPLMAWLSRRDEFEADAFAADHSDAHRLADALVKLYEDNASTLTPDPLHSAFYDSHPPATIRVGSAAMATARRPARPLRARLSSPPSSDAPPHLAQYPDRRRCRRRVRSPLILVRHPEGLVPWKAVARGRRSDCVVGDRVRILPLNDAQAVIESVLPRRNQVTRSDRFRSKTIAANVDLAAVIVSGHPMFDEALLLRILIALESEQIPLLTRRHQDRSGRRPPGDRRATAERLRVARLAGPTDDCRRSRVTARGSTHCATARRTPDRAARPERNGQVDPGERAGAGRGATYCRHLRSARERQAYHHVHPGIRPAGRWNADRFAGFPIVRNRPPEPLAGDPWHARIPAAAGPVPLQRLQTSRPSQAARSARRGRKAHGSILCVIALLGSSLHD